MNTQHTSDFEEFAAEFVRTYWQTVKSRKFSMPPDEPAEETVEELLTTISHKVETDLPLTRSNTSCKLHMSAQSGDWWSFRFQNTADGWRLVDAAARSDDPTKPHDLLDAAYAPYFEPFLRHVSEVANKRTGTT